MNFTAEVIRTSQRKLSSGDNQYEIVLRTENPMILDLGKLNADQLFDIAITLYNSKEVKRNKKDVGNNQI